jgi:hypothetical protein
MGKILRSVLVLGACVWAQPARQLDAGTWVRKSFSVAPGAVGECPDDEAFLKRAAVHFKIGQLPLHLREEAWIKARGRAGQMKAACQEMRGSMERSLMRDWSGLLSMERFDVNRLPPELLANDAQFFLKQGTQGLKEKLQADLGDTLRSALAATALSRGRHLEADYQKNSLMSDKLKTEDLTESELSIVRKSAYLALLRVRKVDLVLEEHVVKEKKGKERRESHWEGKAEMELALYSFDPVTKSFRLAFQDQLSRSESEGSPASIGQQMASGAGVFSSRILELPPFRFTSQTISLDGNWLRPASVFQANTRADLRVHRRFRYLETQEGKNGQDRQEVIGYGFLDRVRGDSACRVRHIGGQDPYIGMSLEEVPGTWWATLGYAWSEPQLSSDVPAADRNGERFYVRHLSPSPTVRLEIRGNAPGDGVYQYFGLDLAGSLGDAEGSLDQFRKDSVALSLPVTGFATGEMALNWGLRFPIRRLFLVAGLQAGVRGSWLFLGNEQLTHWDSTRSRLQSTSDAAGETYWTDTRGAQDARAVDAWLGLVAGAQWSLSVNHGFGVEWRWEALRGRSDWDITQSNGDGISVPSNEGGLGKMQLIFQWVFR